MAENEEKDVVGESKSDKFKRLASKRVVNAIQKIELITNLAASSYESTPEEIAKILAALQGSVDKVKAAFSKQKIDKTVFKL
jgi:L-asparaginase II